MSHVSVPSGAGCARQSSLLTPSGGGGGLSANMLRTSSGGAGLIPVDADLKELAAGEASQPIRAVKAMVDMRHAKRGRPRVASAGTVPFGGTLEDDFPHILSLLEQGDEEEQQQPCAVLIHVRDWPDARVDWVLIFCETATQSHQELWARARASIRKLVAGLLVRQLPVADWRREVTLDFMVQSARWGAHGLEGDSPDVEVTVQLPGGGALAALRVPLVATVAEVRDEARRRCRGSSWVTDLLGEDGRPLKLGCQLADLQLGSPATLTAVLGEVTPEERAVARAKELQDSGQLPMRELRSISAQDAELSHVNWHKFAAYQTSKAGVDVVRLTYSGPCREEADRIASRVRYVLADRGGLLSSGPSAEPMRDMQEVSSYLEEHYPDVQVLAGD